ncbi:hypothetical protein FG379_002167 [Cryptosporidium bovis]|uniref:uncharacterized protein n=1 Tax=Cryptosporidium bovis TaxID=310047 RepID=UPI003519DD61|nr:hypothetical protein FG379_002167 [Cryptosporidium bovis]
MSIIVKYGTLIVTTVLSTTLYYINLIQYKRLFNNTSIFLETNDERDNNTINVNITSNNIFNNFENLPDYIKRFEYKDINNTYSCHEYWRNDIELILNKYLSNTNISSIRPTIQTEYALNYINNTSINNNITFVKLRLKIKYNTNISDYYILPIVYCINDKRIKLKKYKFRDLNHTIKYIKKAIILNNLNKSENEYNKTKNIDLLIHYDDCPIIWDSIPNSIIYNNNKMEYEKCILKSRISREIQTIIINNTITESIYDLNQYSNNKDNFKYKTNIDKITFESDIINISNNSTEYICNTLNDHINNIIYNINNKNINKNNNVLCFGTIQCYLPCYYNSKDINSTYNNNFNVDINKNDIYLDISHKLKKSQIDIFKILHCICKPSENNELLIHSISTHNNTLDLGTIPYVNHFDNSEIIIRSLFLPNNTIWSKKEDTLFFIGRYTDTLRLDLSCFIYNLLSNNKYYNATSTYLDNHVYVSDSNKISCNNRAKFLENKTKCDKNFICRNISLSLNDWISLLLRSKFSLDLSGVGPWSNRLRKLFLFGISIIQNNRSFISNQFYDLPFKKNQLIFNFNDANDIINNINLMNRNALFSEKISNITSNFSLHCLSDYGLTLYYNTLLNKLIYLELTSVQSDYVSYYINTFTVIH